MTNSFTGDCDDAAALAKWWFKEHRIKRACYDFSYVAIEGELTKAKIIDAIIKDEIGNKDAEIALINNELASPGTAEYAAYQALRQHAKEIAAEVLP